MAKKAADIPELVHIPSRLYSLYPGENVIQGNCDKEMKKRILTFVVALSAIDTNELLFTTDKRSHSVMFLTKGDSGFVFSVVTYGNV